MMVALLLYAYARGNRSSRGIERACWEDVAYKVIAGMRTPDHSTIAEFRRRHETDIEELFDDVLGFCREAGLVSVGVITIDGTKIKANASMDQSRSYRELVTQILREAEEIDRAGLRTSFMATRVGMSCPSSCAPRRVARPRWRRRRGGSRSARAGRSARRRPSPSRWWIRSWCHSAVCLADRCSGAHPAANEAETP
jgi:hypothetical protein